MSSRRSNQDWLEALPGHQGADRQKEAFQDLSKYLYKVAYNYLRGRQAKANPVALVPFVAGELAELAWDFTQDTLIQLSEEKFRLLHQYRGDGQFVHWAATIVRRKAARELQRAHWNRRQPVSPATEGDEAAAEEDNAVVQRPDPAQPDLEETAAFNEITHILQKCLAALPDDWRIAIEGTFLLDQSAAEVGQQLEKSANNVYNYVFRGKRQLRQCLEAHGITGELWQS